ncbi:Hepatocyte growth factor activator [Myotis davidii]|uniref:Hepatocyte growth factor activator n=1 Tax=Myotis davidii TaxID=225400 RepID=L5M2S2_MYODS|nr:Hepatocyte growth factor activator [Myotis davidii]
MPVPSRPGAFPTLCGLCRPDVQGPRGAGGLRLAVCRPLTPARPRSEVAGLRDACGHLRNPPTASVHAGQVGGGAHSSRGLPVNTIIDVDLVAGSAPGPGHRAPGLRTGPRRPQASRPPAPDLPGLSPIAAALDPCASSPCLNGGSCTNTQDPGSHHCTCPVGFTGKDCGTEKCFDETRYEYLEEGDSWARVHQGRVEQCQCAGGRVQCEDTRHTACLSSPCLNGGTCHLIVATGTTVCACAPGHAGRLCNIGRAALVLRGEGARALLGVLPPGGLRCVLAGGGTGQAVLPHPIPTPAPTRTPTPTPTPGLFSPSGGETAPGQGWSQESAGRPVPGPLNLQAWGRPAGRTAWGSPAGALEADVGGQLPSGPAPAGLASGVPNTCQVCRPLRFPQSLGLGSPMDEEAEDRV